MHILVVEDEDSVANLISEILAMWGHQVERSATGSDALGKARDRDFDLMFLDISLPDIQGYELIPFFKATCPQAWIVTMTGNNSRDLEANVRKVGIACYMIKPLKLKVLKEVVDHASRRRELPSTSSGAHRMGDIRMS